MIAPIINENMKSKPKINLNKRQQDIVNTARRDGFVTDLEPNKKIIKICKSNNVDLIITSPVGK